MKLKMTKLTVLLAGIMCACPMLRAATSSELLQQGLYAEEVEGNINEAIASYREVSRSSNATRSQIAQALYREGMCHLKVKDETKAREALQKLVTDYSDQTELVAKAHPVLEDLTNFDPASLMPPNTLMYLEFGNPGRQIETIANILKDTPFENPLTLVGERFHVVGPEDIISGLLNPSMLAEFKKIRSSAIGVADLPAQGKPSTIAVLYPGKSDALRGILIAAISMGGKPSAGVGGMQTVNIHNEFAVAYDDRVMIATQPPQLLEWCVKQYKGMTKEPTLASRNEAFAAIDRKQRQENALTFWVKGEEAYTKVLNKIGGQPPRQLIMANTLIDLQHLDTFTLTFGIEPDGLNARARLQFQENHQSLAYDLIRTPNLTAKSFDMLPPETVAVASFALNGSDMIQLAQARAGVKHLTGLDLGRELFANMEQLTVFALPSGAESFGPVTPRLGLAITSRDPAQTRELLTRLLGVPKNLLNDFRRPALPEISQVNGITFLSFDSDILNAVAKGSKQGKSVRSSALAKVLADLKPTASKMVAANAGALIDFAVRQKTPADLSKDRQRELAANLNQLCDAASNTTVEFRTDEQLSDFALSVNLKGLPPLNSVLKPIAEIKRITQEHLAEQQAIEARRTAAAVSLTETAPTIDGQMDELWSRAEAFPLSKIIHEQPSAVNDVAAEFRMLWDKDNFYVLVNVFDENLRRDNDDENWNQDDGVEMYIDALNSKAWEYGDAAYLYNFRWSPTAPESREVKQQRLKDVTHGMVRTDKGYRLEVKFPWATLGTQPNPEVMIGFDLHINDNDSGKRDTILSWNDAEDAAWMRPAVLGNAILRGKPMAEGASAQSNTSHHHN